MRIMYSELCIASVKPDAVFFLYFGVIVPLPQALIWDSPAYQYKTLIVYYKVPCIPTNC